MPEPNAEVGLYATYPDGTKTSWPQYVTVDLSAGPTRVEFDVTLDASHGLGIITWTSEVITSEDSDSANNFGGPVYILYYGRF